LTALAISAIFSFVISLSLLGGVNAPPFFHLWLKLLTASELKI
jgi:hypothetical protein